MDTVQTGKYFEKKAISALKKEGYKIIKHNSLEKWTSLYDLTVEKEKIIYYVEVKGRTGKTRNIFHIKKNKLEQFKKLDKEVIFVLINKDQYKIFSIYNFKENLTLLKLGKIKIQVVLLSNINYRKTIFKICQKCKREIKGTSEGQVKYNFEIHIRQKHPLEPKDELSLIYTKGGNDTLARIQYIDKCPKCKKRIKGTSESQVKYNIETHIRQKHPKDEPSLICRK